MANLSITEYRTIGRDRDFSSPLPVGQEPAVTRQNVSFTATPGASAAFNELTSFIRVIVDADARISFGADPTAGASDTIIAAGQSEYFGVVPGQKISAVTA